MDLAGEWLVTFTGPSGPAEYTMFVAQEGTRVTGRMTWASGEDGRRRQAGGKALLGKRGEGRVHGERIGR